MRDSFLYCLVMAQYIEIGKASDSIFCITQNNQAVRENQTVRSGGHAMMLRLSMPVWQGWKTRNQEINDEMP